MPDSRSPDEPRPEPPPRTQTRALVAPLLRAGLSVSQIAERLGISTPTVCYHARKLGHPPSEKFRRRYDWAEVQRYYDAGHSMRVA